MGPSHLFRLTLVSAVIGEGSGFVKREVSKSLIPDFFPKMECLFSKVALSSSCTHEHYLDGWDGTIIL